MTATDTPSLLFRAHPKQDSFGRAVFSGQYRYLLFGGGIRSGKTSTTLMLLFVLCRIYPGSRWAIVRRDLPTLRRNTLPSYLKLKPHFVGALNQGDWTATCRNGSQILFFSESLSEDPDLDRWKGLEVNGFLLEEANELAGGARTFAKAIERAGSWIIPGLAVQPLPLVLLTCNPSPGWLKETFYDPYLAGTLQAPYYFEPATILDNPSIPEEYRASLENLPEEQYRRYVKGEWDGLDGTRLFRELSDEYHFVAGPPVTQTTGNIIVADWGWTNPAPALWVTTDAGLGPIPYSRVYREWWPTETVPAEWARQVIQRSKIDTGPGGPTAYETDVVILDSAAWAQGQDGAPSVAEQMIGTFRPAGFRLVPSQKGPGSLKQSTMLLHTYFNTGGGRFKPALTIDRECPALWRELTSIRRGEPDLHPAHDPDVEAPHQVNHGTAALRYLVASRPRLADITPAERDALDPKLTALASDPLSQIAIWKNRAAEAVKAGKAVPPRAPAPPKNRRRNPW